MTNSKNKELRLMEKSDEKNFEDRYVWVTEDEIDHFKALKYRFVRIHGPYKKGYLRRVCMYCNDFLGYKKSGGVDTPEMNESHTICKFCEKTLDI